MCAGYADALDGADKVFNRLMYVQRNWEADNNFGKRPKEDFDKLVRLIVARCISKAKHSTQKRCLAILEQLFSSWKPSGYQAFLLLIH